ncbi:MAG: S9 family peptidase [Ignavibacteria bacterium]|nr:S9 family peptidase [Ignavibacteria bacterium]
MKDKRKQYRISQFFAIRSILSPSVSPDNRKVAYITNTNGLPNVWTIPIEGGWTSQITLEENAVKAISYSPRKKEIIFQSDYKGDENLQLYLISDEGGEVKNLTPNHKDSQVLFASWNKKGNRILYSSNKRDKRFFDIYVLDLKSGEEKCIREGNNPFVEIAADWSSDERYILLQKFYNNSDQDILIYDISNSDIVNITRHEGSMKNILPKFSRKSDSVYFLTDNNREFLGLARYDIKKRKTEWFVLENWDIDSFTISKSEKYLLYTVNEDGRSKLILMNLKTGKRKKLKIPGGNVLSMTFTPDEKKIILVLDSPQNPNDIYVYDLKKEKIKQITFSMIGGIPKNDFIKPHKIKYKSFDGLEISAYLYIPKGSKNDGSLPGIVWPHGGPEYQEKEIFNKFFQILVNRGYVVIAPNFRGSTGYGKTFQRLIYRDWGGAEFKDVLGAYDYLLNSGYVDKDNIAVVSGSFGGFMVLTCITKAPELWKCAVDIFGPSDLITFVETVPEHWKPAVYELVGDPVRDREFLAQRSPINFVDNIRCPLFIVQGKYDPRVVKAESDQIVEKLKQQNKEVEYLVLEDEGHGFSKVSNQIKVWEMICDFLDRHMKVNQIRID